MNSFVKRLGSALTASAMMLTAGIFVPVQAADTGADAAPLFTAEAEDCTEDVFVKVLTGDFVFQDETHEKKWLTVTAINLCKDRLKHWWRRQVTAIDEAAEIPDENAASFDETLEAVKRLPVKYKDVIYLYYYMDYKTEEIAGMLKKPPSTVRNHLREARECLRRQIGDVEL